MLKFSRANYELFQSLRVYSQMASFPSPVTQNSPNFYLKIVWISCYYCHRRGFDPKPSKVRFHLHYNLFRLTDLLLSGHKIQTVFPFAVCSVYILPGSFQITQREMKDDLLIQLLCNPYIPHCPNLNEHFSLHLIWKRWTFKTMPFHIKLSRKAKHSPQHIRQYYLILDQNLIRSETPEPNQIFRYNSLIHMHVTKHPSPHILRLFYIFFTSFSIPQGHKHLH